MNYKAALITAGFFGAVGLLYGIVWLSVAVSGWFISPLVLLFVGILAYVVYSGTDEMLRIRDHNRGRGYSKRPPRP